MDEKLYLDIDFNQIFKNGEDIGGDRFLFKKVDARSRVIAVLSDGLGSGVKANILASMTATMALKFIEEKRDIEHFAGIIMDALPICQVRNISYATFTIIDVHIDGYTKIIEMDNPPFTLIRNNQILEIPYSTIKSSKIQNRTMKIYEFYMHANDYLAVYSDGVTQSGMGNKTFHRGFGDKNVQEFICQIVTANNSINANDLSWKIVSEAIKHETNYKALDDITAAVFHMRTLKDLMLYTGPAYHEENDKVIAEELANFHGSKVICGGSSAEIIARQWGKKIRINTEGFKHDLPPTSYLQGTNLVTEGVFTLTRLLEYLENKSGKNKVDPAGQLYKLLLEHDIINFLVGTRINVANQDPKMPVHLEFRKTIILKLEKILTEQFYKEVNIDYF
ncbi:SpoIIE family protein phosphatase [Lentisphaerota bacterium WC36G]|nr:SpoIIE family protein phosphatase [Lentisphaerae bacterium WC36]